MLFQFTEDYTMSENWIEENTNILENDDFFIITAGGVYTLLTQRIHEWDVYSSGNQNSGIWDVSCHT